LLVIDWFKEGPIEGRYKTWAVADIDLKGLAKKIDESYN
jgi:hypothetical protein